MLSEEHSLSRPVLLDCAHYFEKTEHRNSFSLQLAGASAAAFKHAGCRPCMKFPRACGPAYHLNGKREALNRFRCDDNSLAGRYEEAHGNPKDDGDHRECRADLQESRCERRQVGSPSALPRTPSKRTPDIFATLRTMHGATSSLPSAHSARRLTISSSAGPLPTLRHHRLRDTTSTAHREGMRGGRSLRTRGA